MHTSEGTKFESARETNPGPGEADEKMVENAPLLSPEEKLRDGELHDLSLGEVNMEKNESDEMMLTVNQEDTTDLGRNMESSCTSSCAGGARWDVFRRQDVPKLAEYLQRTFQKPDNFVSRPLYEGVFLNEHHKRQLKDEFGKEKHSVPCSVSKRLLHGNLRKYSCYCFKELSHGRLSNVVVRLSSFRLDVRSKSGIFR